MRQPLKTMHGQAWPSAVTGAVERVEPPFPRSTGLPSGPAPGFAPVLEAMRERIAERPPLTNLPLGEMREQTELDLKPWNDLSATEGIRVHTDEWTGPNGARRVRSYRREDLPDDAGVLVFLHGGGWCLGSIDTHDGFCRDLAKIAGVRILALEYGLTPEQGREALLAETSAFVRKVKESQDVRPIFLGGDSAGAHIALETALQDEVQIGGLVLIYGAFSGDLTNRAHEAYGDGSFGLSTEGMRFFWRTYLGERFQETGDLTKRDLTGLPRSLVMAAELDCLCQDSFDLSAAMHRDGGQPSTFLAKGLGHGFIHMAAKVPEAREPLVTIANFLTPDPEKDTS